MTTKPYTPRKRKPGSGANVSLWLDTQLLAALTDYAAARGITLRQAMRELLREELETLADNERLSRLAR